MRRALALLCLSAAAVALEGCPLPPPPPTYDRPADLTAATPLRLGQRTTGHLTGPESVRPRYLVKVPEQGVLAISMSWNQQDGMDRVLIQRGVSAPLQTMECRQRLKADLRFQAEPGYYYLELVPGPEETSYDLVVEVQ
jgi:hypothetical protein